MAKALGHQILNVKMKSKKGNRYMEKPISDDKYWTVLPRRNGLR